jgi:hypothetical protein
MTDPITVNDRADVVVTVSAYALGKTLGLEPAMRELERQIQAPDRASLPAARCIARLRSFASVAVRVDTGGTVLGKVRSRHAHDAWELGARIGAKVWVSVDDDVEATTSTLRDMLVAVSEPRPRIVVAPYVLRTTKGGALVASVDLPRIHTRERLLPSGARLRPVSKSGFGLVAMNRDALAAVRAECGHLAYVDDDGVERLGLFHDDIRDGQWLSEDLAFFARVPSHVEFEALLTGHTSHAGQSLNLAEVEG